MERLGSFQFDPLDIVGRNHDLLLAARIAGFRRAWTDELLYDERVLFEAYNKGLSILPTAELPWYRVNWDRSLVRHERVDVSGPRRPRRGTARSHPTRWPALVHGHRAASVHRLVLATHEPGPGRPRGAGGSRASWGSAGARAIGAIYDLAERLFPAGVARGDPAGARPVPAQAAVEVSRQRPARAAPARARSGSARPRGSRTRRSAPACRHDRRCSRNSWKQATSDP